MFSANPQYRAQPSLKTYTVLLLSIFSLLLPTLVFAADRKQILVLHSYNEHFSWVKEITDGITRNLDDGEWDIWYDYLDSKNLDLQTDPTICDRFFEAKYARHPFDLVITVDDPAYEYFLRTRATIFSNAPCLAIGLNAPPPVRAPETSYIIENPDYAKTLNLALSQYPEAKTIHVVIDQKISGQIIKKQIEAAALTRKIAFDWIDSGTSEHLITRCSTVSPKDILCFAVYFDPSFGYVSNDWLLKEIRQVTRVPIYSFWAFSMQSGAFGGFLYDGYRLGQGAAETATVLLTTKRSPVYIQPSVSSWVFDYNQVKEFGLSKKAFPQAAVFVNQPVDFWTIHKAAFISIFVALGALLVYIFLIMRNLRIKHKVVAYSKRLIATQRELMASLGDVIETRSEETAYHVQRITRLSLLLARLLKIPEEQQQQLELCASMHDIGKIGIPDTILKNPGKLTLEEQKIMQTHTLIGHSIFSASSNPMFQIAATIALEHHEKWDGSGYPYGKAGNSIHILARIVSLVDVFDALLSKRHYKEAWEPEAVISYLVAESGKSFEPSMVTLFLSHWDKFYLLRAKHEKTVKAEIAPTKQKLTLSSI